VRGAAAVAVVAVLAAPAGADEAHIRVPAAFASRVETGEHCGLTISVEADERGPLVTVSQLIRPLPSLPPFPLGDATACGDIEALVVAPGFAPPDELARAAAACRNALDVLVGVVAYVSRSITLDEADRGPQDGRSVLRRRGGRCSGRANLAVGLLRAVGIPARVVHGVVFDGERPRWHRWGEAWLGDLGWLPFDPGLGAGVVGVRYLPCRAVVPGLQPQGVTLVRIDESESLRLPRRRGLLTPLLVGVNLRCRAPVGVTDFTAILVGQDGMRWGRRGDREVSFAGLLPGRYWLTWQTAGLLVPPVPLDLSRHGDVDLVLAARRPAGPSAGNGNAPRPAGRSAS
jgi:hypothetical protein